VIFERRKPTHLTRGSSDTISEPSKELLHLALLLVLCFLSKSLPLIYSAFMCGQQHSLHYEKHAELSVADNLQSSTELGQAEVSNFNFFVSIGRYYQNTFF